MTDVILDIETVPYDAKPGMSLECAPGWEPSPATAQRRKCPGNFKNQNTIEAWEEKETVRHALAVSEELDTNRTKALKHWRDGSLDWRRVRIVCIGLHSEHGSALFECYEPEQERAALLRMLDWIPREGKIVAFGSYDATKIRARLLAHRIHFGPFTTTAKPWERRVVDLQAIAAEVLNGNARQITGISVDALCEFLGIDRPANPISGAEVLDAYVDGRSAEIGAHCVADVRDEFELWQRFEGAL